MIRVKYYGFLKDRLPSVDEEGFWHLDREGLTIGEVMEMTGVPDRELRKTILVNKLRKDTDYVLKDGDVMTIMPLVAGG